MNIVWFKVKSVLGLLVAPALFTISISNEGILAYAFLLAIPTVALLDFLLPRSLANPDELQEKSLKQDRFFDVLIWCIAPVAMACLICYLIHIYRYSGTQSLATLIGWTTAMGGIGAIWGIAVGHELGHRSNPFERFLGGMLLFTCLRMTFTMFHNYGHHPHVGTPKDPTSADRNEWTWLHLPKSLVLSIVEAWRIQLKILRSRKLPFWSIKNQVFWVTVLQVGAVLAVYFVANWQTALAFVAAGATGALLFELINYVEHYGLRRRKLSSGHYERVLPIHSWNDSHSVVGSILLNGMRHSDHHYTYSRPYQLLRHYESIPTNLPASSAAMMLLALIPPLYFYIMNPKIDEVERRREELESGDARALRVLKVSA